MSERIKNINFEFKTTQNLSIILESLANSKEIATSKKLLEAIIASKTSEGAGALSSLLERKFISSQTKNSKNHPLIWAMVNHFR
jgi:hypothetical protein